nr:UBP1-associated protein 2C-like [Tanacetum cinerariifolium]
MINQSKKCKTKTLNDTVHSPNKTHSKFSSHSQKTNSLTSYKPSSPMMWQLSIADTDHLTASFFIRGIGWDTTTATLKFVFEIYGEVEEVLIIVDKATNKSKGYDFVTFKCVDGAVKSKGYWF